MTIRKMDASTRAPVGDDGIFASTHNPARTLRRRSSRLSKWLQELRDQSSSAQQQVIYNRSTEVVETVETVETQSNPYMAYPHLNFAAGRTSIDDDVSSMYDYVVVNDDDMHDYTPEEPTQEKVRHLLRVLDYQVASCFKGITCLVSAC